MGADADLARSRRARQTDGDPAVVGEVREEGDEVRVEVGGYGLAKHVLVEAGGRVHLGGEAVVSRNGRHEVVCICRHGVHAVGGHSCELTGGVLGHDFHVDTGRTRHRRIVACFAVVASPVDARTVVVRSGRVEVQGCGIGAAGHFEGIADAITICIGRTTSEAVVPCSREGAGAVVVGGGGQVVAGRKVRATGHFEGVTHTVAVAIGEAISCAVVPGCCKGARAVVVRRSCVEVARRRGGAAGDFITVADAVAVGVSYASASTSQPRCRIGARTVVVRGSSIEVARRSECATRHFIAVAHAIAIDVGEAAARAIQSGIGKGARAIVVRGCRIEVAGTRIGAASHFIGVTHAVAIRIRSAVARTIQSSCRVGARRGDFRAVAGFVQIHRLAEVRRRVAIFEELDVHLARQAAIRGELAQENAVVVPCHTVCISGQCVPSSSDGIVDDQIVSCFK